MKIRGEGDVERKEQLKKKKNKKRQNKEKNTKISYLFCRERKIYLYPIQFQETM